MITLNRKRIPTKDFIPIYQAANNVQEVAEHFGITKRQVNNKACNLRKKGVKLKKFAHWKVNIGDMFGEFEVLEIFKGDHTKARVRCSCGKILVKNISTLVNKKIRCCKTCTRIPIKMGQRFGRWVVKDNTTRPKVLCQCDCGILRHVLAYSLRNGESQSCGCLHNEKLKERMTSMLRNKDGTFPSLQYDKYCNAILPIHLNGIPNVYQTTLNNEKVFAVDKLIEEYHAYPDIPSIFYAPHFGFRRNVPKASGIYFIVDAKKNYKYIGQSKNLNTRLSGHICLDVDDFFNWVLIDEHDLNLAECYYIGLLRPYANFN